MEKSISQKQIVVSEIFQFHRQKIYMYALEVFGFYQAEIYLQKINLSLSTLYSYRNIYHECRYLITSQRVYRNIILDAHLIIFRITQNRIEVLDILHSASGIKKIKETKKVKIP